VNAELEFFTGWMTFLLSNL